MFLNENIVHLCLECNFAFSQREYEKLKFKSFIFSFGKTNVKCSNCKTKDNFIHVSTSWANILYTQKIGKVAPVGRRGEELPSKK